MGYVSSLEGIIIRAYVKIISRDLRIFCETLDSHGSIGIFHEVHPKLMVRETQRFVSRWPPELKTPVPGDSSGDLFIP